MSACLRPAARAFDAIAADFDIRFGEWQSVAAQRRAVRSALLNQFPAGGRILELGGGTGEDAAFLARRGFQVLTTDPSPAMVSVATKKLAPLASSAQTTAAEDLEQFADCYLSAGGFLFDGAFSNFAPLNCVFDLRSVARGLSRLLAPGAPAMLVLFGTFCPGEVVTEILRGRPHLAFRRIHSRTVQARLAKQEFAITYHRRSALERDLAPWFALERQLGIGIAVPPSAAEPWISRHPRLLAALEACDRRLSRTLATFGDHILYQFRRTTSE